MSVSDLSAEPLFLEPLRTFVASRSGGVDALEIPVWMLDGSSQGHADLLLAFFGGGGWLLRLLFDVDIDADQYGNERQPADCGRGQARKLSKVGQRCGWWASGLDCRGGGFARRRR